MRKVYISEKQLQKLMEEGDFVTYLDKSDKGCNIPSDSLEAQYSEVSAGNGATTTDKVANMRYRHQRPFVRMCYDTSLFESNLSDDRNKKLTLGKNTNDDIEQIAANNPNDKMLNNMANEKSASADALYVRLNRLKTMKTANPERYTRINGSELEKAISDKLKAAEKNSQSANNTTFKEQKPVSVNDRQSGAGHHNQNKIYYEND